MQSEIKIKSIYTIHVYRADQVIILDYFIPHYWNWNQLHKEWWIHIIPKNKNRGSRSCFFGNIEKRIDKNIKDT